MSRLLRDLRLAARSLRRTPGFTLIVILTLGLGVGANTAIFTGGNAVLLRPLAAPHPEELISVRESSRQFPAQSVASSVPRVSALGLDWRVLGFAAGLALLTSLLFGLLPALYARRATEVDPIVALRYE